MQVRTKKTGEDGGGFDVLGVGGGVPDVTPLAVGCGRRGSGQREGEKGTSRFRDVVCSVIQSC